MVHQRASSNMANYKLLIASAALFGSVIASPNNGIQSSYSASIRRQDQDVCTTDVCKSYAKLLLASRATNYTDIDPCTDFATYTCGNWGANHSLRADESSVTVFSVVNDVNTALLKSILESPYPSNTTVNSTYAGANATALDKQNFDKMVAAYDSCMDVDAINEAGAKPLQDILDAYDAFSSSGSGNNTTDLTDKMIWVLHYGGKFNAEAHTTASIGFVQAIPWVDDKNPDVTTVALGAGKFGLGAQAYYEDAEAIANYTTAIVGMFDVLLPEEEHDTHVSHASEIITLERALIAAAPGSLDLADPSFYYNPLPIAEADALLPEIPFSRLIKGFAPSNYTIDTVIVFSPDYFTHVSSVLKNTTSDTLDAYLQWVLIQTWATHLSDDVSAPYRRFINELSGVDPDTVADRSTTCLADIDTNLPWIETAFFIRSAFSPEAKTLGERIITDIKAVFEAKLANYTWMSAAVKTEAIQKVVNIIEKIGYPDISPNVQDPKALADFYAPLNVSASSWFQNGIAYNNFTLTRAWNSLLHPTDKYYWVMTGPEVNADYINPTNDITLPAGIMQTPFFTLDLPDWANYGAFGAVAGHEITHAFDNLGSQYDENGAYRNWWDNATLAVFEEKAQCFVEEFSNYTITAPNGTQVHVDGELTLSENIADTGGLSAAYAAWQESNSTANQLLPGLEQYTTEQLFYLAFGNVWCGSTLPTRALRLILIDPHSPSNARISGTVANQVGFREAFNCPSKVPTCELW